MKLILIALVTFFPSVAEAWAREPVEKWECYDYLDLGKSKVLIKLGRGANSPADKEKAKVTFCTTLASLLLLDNSNIEYCEKNTNPDYASQKTGQVIAAGKTQSTLYEVQGLNRRWYWYDPGEKYGYSFFIEPDGTGLYYDFRHSEGKETKPSDFFKCEQR